MKFERLRNPNYPVGKVLVGLAALTLTAAGCSEGNSFTEPIRIPDNAQNLGITSDNMNPRYTVGPGRSYLVYVEDASYVECGEGQANYSFTPSDEFQIDKQVKATGDGMAQVTCFGADQDGFPVQTFPSHHKTVAGPTQS